MKGWQNIILISVICVGLIFCSILFFRDDLEPEIGEVREILGKYLKNVSPAALNDAVNKINTDYNPVNPNIQPVAAAPGGVAPNTVTGATPRIINWINDIVNRVKPAVVGICVGNAAKAPPWQQDWAIVTPSGRRSIGSGIIVHPQGYVITNYHVVSLGGKIVISIFSGKGYKDYPAELIVGDKKEDLALLKIVSPVQQEQTFSFVPIGDSDKVSVGDKVIAIGNPFGLTQSVTGGIISARRRRLPIGEVVLYNVFQTDVPISPGNSGGALLNVKGEVIGITTAIFSPIESVYTGISFAVPINRAKKKFGNFLDLTAEVRKPSLTKPASYKFVGQAQPYYRYVAGAVQPELQMRSKIQPSPGEGIEEIAWLGIDVIPENDSDTAASEVVVDEIEGITAMESGLQAGDIIRSINGYPTPNMYQFKEAVKKVPLREGQGVVLDVYRPRNNQPLFIGFRLKRWDLHGR